ncbi:MAG TPA: MMPL family transporter [Polyangiaceae bacterium]|nr:MMPL family transporter [Polyangiaceae bacterium]
MSAPGPRTRAFVAWTLRHGRAIWIVALLLAVPATLRTISLYAHLKSDVEALLPRRAPAVLAVDELRRRMPGLQYLGVLVDTGSPAELQNGERFIDDLAARIRAYPKELVRRVRTGDGPERAFVERHAALYVDLADLREVRRRVEERRDYEVAKGMDLGLDDEPPPPLRFSDLEQKYRNRFDANGGGTGAERFSSEAQHLTMLLVEVGSFETGRGNSAQLLDRVKSDVASLDVSRYGRGFRVGYTGDVAISVEETSALMEDLSISTVLVIVAVVAALVSYYRWRYSVLVLVPPLLLATVYSFAIASLPPFSVRELNSNTAFLGSIIVGNGINFGIMLLARYVEERRRGLSPDDALPVAVHGARSGTLAAALAAGTSYAALSITEFQGFRQFGVIGGIGMVVSWLSAQVLLPPLTRWVDSAPARAPRELARDGAVTRAVARAVTRAPVAITLASLVVTALALVSVRSFGEHSLEYDFSKLRRADTWTRGEGYWGRRMDGLLGRYLTPMVVLTDGPAQTEAVAARLRSAAAGPPLSGLVSTVLTGKDVVPTDQDAKIQEATALRRVLTPRIASELGPDEKKVVDRFLGKDVPRKITAADVPETLTAGLRERDGRIDRAVLVFPKPSHALWEGPSIERFSAELRRVASDGESTPPMVAGSLSVSADILSRIRRDGPLASLVAFLGVAATVLALFRASRTSALVLGSLVASVLWLLSLTVLFGVRINFANFIAFPITFGIGVDYAVNVVTRYVQDGERDVGLAVRSAGGAVGLCSLTTIIGYSSLLLAENRALFLFGVLAVLGEIVCLSTAVVALPAALESFRRHRERHGGHAAA